MPSRSSSIGRGWHAAPLSSIWARSSFSWGAPGTHAIIAGYLRALRRNGVESVAESDLRSGLTGVLLRRFIISTYGVAGWKTASAREESILVRGIERIQEAVDVWEAHDPDEFLP